MEDYNIALFLHLVGMAGLFAAIGVEMAGLQFARRAGDVAGVRSSIAPPAVVGPAIPVFAVIILVSGGYMVEDVWDWDIAWIYISLAVFLVLLAAGALVNSRRVKAIAIAAGQSPDGPVSPELREKLDAPVLETSERTMLLATVGIVWLMTVKPEPAAALLAMAIFVVAGLALSVPAWKKG
jgi:hypothetical protein